MEFVDPFGWHVADTAVIHFIRTKLSNFETMTWSDITIKAKKQNHTVAAGMLCARAQKRLKDLKLDDLDGLLSLRLSGAQRVWGLGDIRRWCTDSLMVGPQSRGLPVVEGLNGYGLSRQDDVA
jgi:hypothetical protein